ncbi:MAG: hypothetical protein ACM362_00830 [Candidatus Methylomirabilota bacterium]
MTRKQPPRQPPAPASEPTPHAAPETAPETASEAEQETEASTGAEVTSEEEADPYDELWDPDMDTRPVRIKRTKVRQRSAPGSRGRPAPKGRRRDEA